MSKISNQQIADAYFKRNKDADQVHICGGFEFKTNNAAQLHLNTSAKKGLKVVSFERKQASGDNKSKAPKPLNKMNLNELQAVAKLEGVRADENATKTQLVEAINTVRESKETA